MRTIAEHQAAVLSHAEVLPTETIAVDVEALSRTLAADQLAINAIPPFDNSAMDGFIIHRADLDSGGNAQLRVDGEVAAGDTAQIPPLGAAVRIMTGAPVDTTDADLVIVPVEYTDIEPGPQPLPRQVRIDGFDSRKLHIRRKGESLQVGQQCAHAGQDIDVGMLSTLISAGIGQVEVYALPRVAVVSTGNELRQTGESLDEGKIPDSNSPMIAGLVRACGIDQVTIAHCDDSPEHLRKLFTDLSANYDVIITTGGVAVGVYDVVRDVLVTHASQSWFGRVQHKPGSHQGVSLWAHDDSRQVPVVSLPGNPVAAFVSFHLYVHPLLNMLRGKQTLDRSPKISAQVVGEPPSARDRDVLVPAIVDFTQLPTTVTPFHGRHVGSHMISSLVGVNAMVHLRAGEAALAEGDMVEVILLPSVTR